MPFAVTWSPSPNQVAAEFDQWGRNIKSLKEPLDRIIREVCIPAIKTQFSEEGVPEWQPLAEFTINKKGSDRILWETGELEKQAALIKNWTVKGPEGKATLDKLSNSVFYGYLHQTGFVNWVTGRQTAARVWGAFLPGDAERASEIVWDFFQDRATKDLRMAIVGVG
ncbi:MAG: hypothetical protein ABL876_00175 [Chitinophagaceae bacterium]